MDKGDGKTRGTDNAPRTWWQWILVYPTLAIAIAGSVPTIIEMVSATQLGVPFGTSKSAIAQEQAWKRNLTCTTAPLDPLITERKIEVDATICRTGDVLVRIKTPDGLGVYKWVNLDAALGVAVANSGFSLFREAYAGDFNSNPDLNPSSVNVHCQFFGPKRQVIRVFNRIGYPTCDAQAIDPRSGEVFLWASEIPPNECQMICSTERIDMERYPLQRRR